MGLRTVFDILDRAARTWGPAPALHQPIPGGKGYRTYDWNEYRTIVVEIACGLRVLGFRSGDIIGLDSDTRAEFYLADIGIMSNGCTSAAVYTSYPFDNQVRTLQACDAKAVFVESPKTLRSLRAAGGDALPVLWILMTGEADGVLTVDELRAKGREALAADPAFFDQIHSQANEEDYAILYLTSGATGEPKMGLVKHKTILANAAMAPPVLPIGPKDATLAFLPSAHITQRLVMQLLMLYMGVPVHFSEGLTKMPNELKTVRPTFFVAPPRVWERVYASITTEIRRKPAALRKLAYMAIGLGSEAAKYRQRGENAPQWLRAALAPFNKIVFDKIRARLGGRMRIAASGAAPLGKDLADFYAAIGMPLVEGYGLTEGGVVTLNPVDRPKPGSIGKKLPGADLELRIDDDGELLIKGPTLFSGYYKDQASTEAVLRDGWLYTGDIAAVDEEGFYSITGRKKELIVSSNGKKIFPARIESLFKVEPIVNQVMLIGDRMPYVTALFTVNPTAAESLRGMETHKGKPADQLVQAAPVQEEVKRAVGRVNKQLASFEQIRKFKLVERDFSIEAGEMTPTMKVRRARVLENFRERVAEMYAGKEEYL
ncbi:MAG TPA: long-chain fatty acid--CoA ligase [Solibacterales bacterium]|nr:long-chain fatty acid--CoA ligase [Bryobacterales bacterium]